MLISVVVPCYKSELTLPVLTEQLSSLDLSFGNEKITLELIYVVDGSPDQTLSVAQELSKIYPNLKVLGLSRNFGQHNALMAGIKNASGEIIVTIDDDLQHRPSEIPQLLRPIIENQADLVYGVPWVEEHSVIRSFASRLIKKMLRGSGVSHAEYVGAFRAFKSRLAQGFVDVTDSHVNLDVLLSWTTTGVLPIKVHMDQRVYGQSSYDFLKLVKHSLNMITGYGVGPLKLATLIGFCAGFLGLTILVWEVVRYFLGYNTVEGFTTISGLVSLFAGTQLITIGIMGEYVGRLFFRSMGKPMYLISTFPTQQGRRN